MFVKVEAYLYGQFKFNSRVNDDLRRLYGRLAEDETHLALSVLRGPTLLDEAQVKVFRKLTDLARDVEEFLNEFD
jgi:ribonucleotide reductase beta subunit family protein with ferritin-like domain